MIFNLIFWRERNTININNTQNKNETNNYELDDIGKYLSEKQNEFQTNFNKLLYDS